MDRIYGVLEIKAADDEKREIEGIASTISTDRDGDVLIPEGAVIKTPFPFLYHHDRFQPIGQVYEAKVTKQGIHIKARLAKVASPSQLAGRLDEAWVSIKSGLIRGISVGFRPLKRSINEATGGFIFDSWEMLECSAVTIPANQDANITRIKSIDSDFLAASGIHKKSDRLISDSSGVSGKYLKSIKIIPKEGITMDFAEKIASFRAELEAKKAKRDALIEKSLENGETFDAAQNEEYETLENECKALEDHLVKAEKLLASKAATAKAVTNADGNSEKKAVDVRQSSVIAAQVKTTEKLEKGIAFSRYVMCQVKAKGNLQAAFELAKKHYPDSESVVKALKFQAEGGDFESLMKTAVAGGTTTDSTWAGPLVNYQDFAGDFVEYLRPRTIIGRFGTGGIPALRKIPFNVNIKGQTSGGTGYWVGEGKPKPVTKFDFNDVNLGWAKAAAIAVLTDELIRFSNPSAESLVRDSLAGCVIERLDTDFIDPAKAVSSGVSPASITNGASAIVSSGSDVDAIKTDLKALWQGFIDARISPTSAVYIMNSTVALALSLMENPLGQPEFPGITINGGSFKGIPVIVSDYVPTVSDGSSIVVLANASDIWFSDDGQVTIDASREASLQMLDNPTNASSDGTPTTMVSMFQTNSVALRAERYINWKLRRDAAVQYVSGVTWGSSESV